MLVVAVRYTVELFAFVLRKNVILPWSSWSKTLSKSATIVVV